MSYDFVAVKEPLMKSLGQKGPAEEVFGDDGYRGVVTGLEIAFIVGYGLRSVNDAVFKEFSADLPESAIGMVYRAYGPKRKLWRTVADGLVASKGLILRSPDFVKRMSLEDLVDFAVSEAERLFQKFGVTVKVAYHYKDDRDAKVARRYIANS